MYVESQNKNIYQVRMDFDFEHWLSVMVINNNNQVCLIFDKL